MINMEELEKVKILSKKYRVKLWYLLRMTPMCCTRVTAKYCESAIKEELIKDPNLLNPDRYIWDEFDYIKLLLKKFGARY